MKCINCGAELPNDAKFCFECGVRIDSAPADGGQAPESEPVKNEEVQQQIPVQQDMPECYCPYCGQPNSGDAVFCSGCGRPINANYQAVQNPERVQGKKKNGLPIVIGVVVAVAVIAVAAVVGVKLVKGEKGGSAEGYVTYVKDGSLYSLNGKKPEKGADEYGGSLGSSVIERYGLVQISSDGKYLFYPSSVSSDYSEGYRLNAVRFGKKNAESVKIDSDVRSYQVLDNKRLLFMDTGNTLYLSDFTGNKEKVASDVSLYYLDTDKQNIVWVSEAGEYSDIYYRPLSLKEEKEKLSSDVILMGSSDNLRRIYVKDENDSLYVIKDFGDKEKIASDVSMVVYGSFNSDIVFYSKERTDKLTAASLIEDDMKATDDSMKEPQEEDYQKNSLEKNYLGEYEKVTETDWDAYYAAWDEYDEKQERDEMRENMKEYVLEDYPYELYCYNGKDSSLVDENYSTSLAVYDGGVVYTRYNTEDIEKVRLSDVGSLYEVEEKYREKKEDSLEVCLYENGKQVMLSENIDICKVDQEAGKAYGLEYDKESTTGILYEFAIGARADGSLKKVADDVSRIEFAKNGKIYYMVDADGDEGELCSNGESIDTDVVSGSVYELDGVIYYQAEASSSGDDYTMKCYDGKKAKIIAEDVVCEKVLDANHIFLLTDYSWKNYRGDLRYYNGKDAKTIEDDVTWIMNVTNTWWTGGI